MTVTKEITRLEKSSVKLNITVAKDDVRSEYDALLSEYTKSIQLPGFRKGKVPRDVLVRKFADALKGEALGKIIEKSLGELFDDENFPREERPLPYSTPRVDEEPKLDTESDLRFSVIYDVLPAVKVEKWEGIEIEVPDVSVSDEDLARELETMRDRNSIVLDKDEEEAAASGDVVTVDYWELDDSGTALAGSERKDFSFTLGSGLNAYKFDDEITGMKKGETKEFTKTYPEDFEEKTLAGKTKKIRLALTALKEKQLPDLDDDLAQDVDEKYETLDDLKNGIRERLENELENRLRNMKLNNILEKIMENTPVEIPESMLRMELDSRWRNLARRFNTDSNGLYKIMGNSPEQAESIIESWKPDAVKALHSRLIVETLIEELKLEASDDEVEDEIDRIVDLENDDKEEEIRKYYEEEMAREYLKEDIKEKKFFDLLLEKSVIKAGEKVGYLELASSHHHDHDHDEEQDDIDE